MGCINSIPNNAESQPRQLSNMRTFIPLSCRNGQYTSVYPAWLTNYISVEDYTSVINQLNSLNKVSLLWNKKRMKQYKKLSESNCKRLMELDRQTLNKDTDKLLFEINAKTLNPLGINAVTMFEQSESGFGIIIQVVQSLVSMTCPRSEESEGNFIILNDYIESMNNIDYSIEYSISINSSDVNYI